MLKKQDAACSRELNAGDARIVSLARTTGRRAANQGPSRAGASRYTMASATRCLHDAENSPLRFARTDGRDHSLTWSRDTWSWHAPLPALSFFKSASSGSTRKSLFLPGQTCSFFATPRHIQPVTRLPQEHIGLPRSAPSSLGCHAESMSPAG